MNDTIVSFNFDGTEIRALDQDGQPWFVLSDVCAVLDISNPSDAASRLDDDEKNTIAIADGTPGNPNKLIINESGLYSLILTSRKESAKQFKKWVTSEVLPQIRKTGKYSKSNNANMGGFIPNTGKFTGTIRGKTIEELAQMDIGKSFTVFLNSDEYKRMIETTIAPQGQVIQLQTELLNHYRSSTAA